MIYKKADSVLFVSSARLKNCLVMENSVLGGITGLSGCKDKEVLSR